MIFVPLHPERSAQACKEQVLRNQGRLVHLQTASGQGTLYSSHWTDRGNRVPSQSSLASGKHQALLDTSYYWGIRNSFLVIRVQIKIIKHYNSLHCTVFRNIWGGFEGSDEVNTWGWGSVSEPFIINIACHYSKNINEVTPNHIFFAVFIPLVDQKRKGIFIFFLNSFSLLSLFFLGLSLLEREL